MTYDTRQHSVITELGPDANCHRPNPALNGRWEMRRLRPAGQCASCLGTHPAELHPFHGWRVKKHTPTPPAVTHCPVCHQPYWEVNGQPVYGLPHTDPICEACSLADPTGEDDDGAPVWAPAYD